MKIAYLLGSLSRGGTETLVLDVFKNADKAGYDFIGVHRKDGPYKEVFYATKPEFMECGVKHKNLLGYLWRLRKLLKKNGVTVVHAQQTIDAVFAYFACLGTEIKVVETFHGYDFGIGSVMQWLTKMTFKWCDAMLFVSAEEMNYYLNKYGRKYEDKCHVVYNGVNFDKIIRKSEDVGSSSATLKLGAVGNFVPVREQSSICKFLNLLNKEGVSFDFYFVGRRSDAEPWLYDDCVEYCKANGLSDKVHFMGSRNDVPELLTTWDAFIYSTDHDTFGIAVVEAIAAGLPTFVNDWEVMCEITDNGKLAHLYKTKDPQDLLHVFKHYLSNREQYNKEALQNASTVREKFSIEHHIHSLKSVYEMLN